MWHVLKKQDVMNYWKVAEFVSVVMEMVPELLMYKHRMQLDLGLRARVGTGGGEESEKQEALMLPSSVSWVIANIMLVCKVWLSIGHIY